MTHVVIRSVIWGLDKIPLLLRQPHGVFPVGHLLSISPASLKLDGNYANVTLHSPRTGSPHGSDSDAVVQVLPHSVRASSLKQHNASSLAKEPCSLFWSCVPFLCTLVDLNFAGMCQTLSCTCPQKCNVVVHGPFVKSHCSDCHL